MKIGEVARRAHVTPKAVRYYERLGLLTPERSANGYRDYEDAHVRVVIEVRELATLGIPPGKAHPFVECLDAGHQHADDCVSSMAVYRDSIADLDRIIAALSARRTDLANRLDESSSRTFPQEKPMTDFRILPGDLPAPADDGAADHLPGHDMPDLQLTTSSGHDVDLANLGDGRAIIYLYPLTGRPGVDLPDGWDAIPGARGCSTEACGFRDHFQELQSRGVDAVYGLSSQTPQYQAEVVERLRLPFTMISDRQFQLADLLDLPTFGAEGHDRLYSRLTLIVRNRQVEKVFYPIFPPNTHAQEVLAWLQEHPD